MNKLSDIVFPLIFFGVGVLSIWIGFQDIDLIGETVESTLYWKGNKLNSTIREYGDWFDILKNHIIPFLFGLLFLFLGYRSFKEVKEEN